MAHPWPERGGRTLKGGDLAEQDGVGGHADFLGAAAPTGTVQRRAERGESKIQKNAMAASQDASLGSVDVAAERISAVK